MAESWECSVLRICLNENAEIAKHRSRKLGFAVNINNSNEMRQWKIGNDRIRDGIY
jgi:hypothetical protein